MPHNHLQEVLHQISWYPSEWFLGFPLVTPPPKPKKKSGQKRLSLRICALRPGFKMLFASSKNKGRNIPSDIATETCPWGLTCTNHGVSTLAVNWTDCCQSLGYLPSTFGSSQINPNILLMEEIVHQLGCTTPYKKWDELPTSNGWGFLPSTVDLWFYTSLLVYCCWMPLKES